MSDRTNGDGPIIGRDQAPDHGPGFWSDLENTLSAETVLPAHDPQRTAQRETTSLAAVPSRGADRLDATSQMAAVEPVSEMQDRRQRQSRRLWPMAAAAALLAIVGIGFVAARDGNDLPATAEVVAGAEEDSSGGLLDGPTETDDGVADADADPVEDGETEPTGAEGSSSQTNTSTTPEAGAAAGPTPVAAPVIPDFASAPGAVGEPEHLPLDQGLPENATFLANWSQVGVTWFAVTTPSTTCNSASHSQIRYVNASGITQDVRDPQLSFSGVISHFTLHRQENLAAWVVSCGTQLELYVAELAPTGEIATIDLVWLGDGTVSSALIIWEADEVSLNAIEPQGTAFNVDYNLDTMVLSRNGGPSRIMIEAGAPAERSLTPLAATPDGGMTYWAGKAPAGTLSACSELYGSGQSDTLWLRQGEGQWQLAVADDVPLASVTAMAIEPELSQIAFADVCDGETGRVFIGTQRADGRISNLREVDLAPFVPGYAAELFWADSQTLRIETDNTAFGFGTVRFDFRFDDGQNNGIIVQLD